MVRANLGRGLVIMIGVALIIGALFALNMPDHATPSGHPSFAAADTGGSSS